MKKKADLVKFAAFLYWLSENPKAIKMHPMDDAQKAALFCSSAWLLNWACGVTACPKLDMLFKAALGIKEKPKKNCKRIACDHFAI